ncbi:hypothetical protein LTR94_036931, partial [Friedmanniomyces endolithicus]
RRQGSASGSGPASGDRSYFGRRRPRSSAPDFAEPDRQRREVYASGRRAPGGGLGCGRRAAARGGSRHRRRYCGDQAGPAVPSLLPGGRFKHPHARRHG